MTMTAVVGIAVFTPPHAAPRILASESQLTQNGTGSDDPALDEFLAMLRRSSPAEIAKKWADAGPSEQKEIRATLPPSAGNLDGLPYEFRDSLNRRALSIRTDVMTRRVKQSPGDVAAKTTLASYRAIAKALRRGRPRRQLITLTADEPALAAISIGDLDTATDVTWLIPGMGTYTTDMPLWSLAAQNLYQEQGRVGAPKTRAVIAWMGYVPPPPPPSVEAARGFYAESGAPHLLRDISAYRATRATDASRIDLNVVAHSYGTTLTGYALAGTDLGIRSVVMLGSAGIENFVGDASALHAGTVYAGEAAKDPQARLGRLSRTDPRAPAFGAIVFGCDGDPRHHLSAVTGHSPILHSTWNDDIRSSLWANIVDTVDRARRFAEHKERFGYLDRGTESLANAASATTRHSTRPISNERIPGSVRPKAPQLF